MVPNTSTIFWRTAYFSRLTIALRPRSYLPSVVALHVSLHLMASRRYSLTLLLRVHQEKQRCFRTKLDSTLKIIRSPTMTQRLPSKKVISRNFLQKSKRQESLRTRRTFHSLKASVKWKSKCSKTITLTGKIFRSGWMISWTLDYRMGMTCWMGLTLLRFSFKGCSTQKHLKLETQNYTEVAKKYMKATKLNISRFFWKLSKSPKKS